MRTLRYLVVTAAVGLAVAAAADQARANPIPYVGQHYGGNPPPTLGRAMLQSHQGQGGGFGGVQTPRQGLWANRTHAFFQSFQQPKLPVFQAAPWSNYWPYDGHFLTPAPINGQFYGPPLTGNFPVNPYFPGPAIPTGGFGPMPGGPPPGIPMLPPGGGR